MLFNQNYIWENNVLVSFSDSGVPIVIDCLVLSLSSFLNLWHPKHPKLQQLRLLNSKVDTIVLKYSGHTL